VIDDLPTDEPLVVPEVPSVRGREPITNYGAVAFLFLLFFLALALMYAIAAGRG
jgi:hypothetical protein